MRMSMKFVVAVLVATALCGCERQNNEKVKKTTSDNVVDSQSAQEKDWEYNLKYDTTFFAKQDVICRSGGVITDDFKSVDVVRSSNESRWLKVYVNQEAVYMSGDCTIRPSRQQ